MMKHLLALVALAVAACTSVNGTPSTDRYNDGGGIHLKCRSTEIGSFVYTTCREEK